MFFSSPSMRAALVAMSFRRASKSRLKSDTERAMVVSPGVAVDTQGCIVDWMGVKRLMLTIGRQR